MTLLAGEIESVRRAQAVRIEGRVRDVRGLVVLVEDLPAPVGAMVRIATRSGPVLAEIVGFAERRAIVMALMQTSGVCAGDRAVVVSANQSIRVGPRMVGRVINGLGQPLDGGLELVGGSPRSLQPDPMSAMTRSRITEPLRTGVGAIDLMTPLGRGQRMGIFAGPGVGKSTLLSQIARATDADVNVIALIGERGREVREFIEDALGQDGLSRSVVVVATSDESPLMRLRAARLACTVAEHFRDQGQQVLLMMDSVTRFAHAQRQVGLSAGEPPATRGYTPSVFAAMASLLERAGGSAASGGSITGLYSILVEGDDMTEPIADAARGVLDGHIMLSRKIAHRGHFPAIDILDSVSRVADHVIDQAHKAARRHLLRLEAKYREVEELVQIGAYARGSHPETDVAIELHDDIENFLRQPATDRRPFETRRAELIALAMKAADAVEAKRQSPRAAKS